MGFSLIGTLIALSIFAPNLLMIKFPPNHVPVHLTSEGLMYTLLERVGQVGCIGILVISKDNFQDLKFSVWLLLIIISIASYYYLWIRYVVMGQKYTLLWEPLMRIPIPMAVFPVCAFGFAAIWGKSIGLGIVVIVFSIGHFKNSWNSYQYFK